MRNLLYSLLLVFFSASLGAYAIDARYSDTFVNNLKLCKPYSETIEVSVPTGNPDFPVIPMRSTDVIKGMSAGRCHITSTVFSYVHKRDIINADCAFTKSQILSLTRKMKVAKTNPTVAKQLQAEIENYIQNDPNTCQVRNLIQQ